MENTQNIFTGKTVEEAVETALASLGIKKEDAQITVLDEGKKGIFGIGGSKAKVKVETRATDGERAVKFIDGLFDILKINAVSEIVSDGEKRGAMIVENAKQQAQIEADRIIANAKAEAAQEMARAREQLRDEVAALAVAGAQQILAREVDKNVHTQLLEQLKAKL